MKTMIKEVIALLLCLVAPWPLSAAGNDDASNDRQLVSFTEYFTGFDGTKGSLDGLVVLAGKYNDRGTRHEDFTVVGANADGSEVYITVTGKITTSQGTMSLAANGTIHFVSDEFAYIEGSESITGGTGAYANANGKGSFVASQDGDGNPYQVVGTFKIGASPEGHLGNISTRGYVDSGERVQIGGLILRGGNDLTPVIVRALGPSLATQGIAAPLPDPTLDLRDKNGTRVAFNDNWKDDPSQVSAISDAGLAPADIHEAAIFAMLPSGEYTAIVADKTGKNGTAVVEMYNLND
jgi:hypothetical protein